MNLFTRLQEAVPSDMTRYDVSNLAEAQWQPGSRGRVLRNLVGITRKREMDRLEAEAQVGALRTLIAEYGVRHRFTAGDICRMHKVSVGRASLPGPAPGERSVI